MPSIVLFKVLFYQHEMFFQTVDGGAESCLSILNKAEAAHAGGS